MTGHMAQMTESLFLLVFLSAGVVVIERRRREFSTFNWSIIHPTVPANFKLKQRAGFDGLFILSGGFAHENAEQALLDKRGDLIAFGPPFQANPDLVAGMRQDAELNAPDEATFYVPGAKGYTDYPSLTTSIEN